jgi:hypothetical protein
VSKSQKPHRTPTVLNLVDLWSGRDRATFVEVLKRQLMEEGGSRIIHLGHRFRVDFGIKGVEGRVHRISNPSHHNRKGRSIMRNSREVGRWARGK